MYLKRVLVNNRNNCRPIPLDRVKQTCSHYELCKNLDMNEFLYVMSRCNDRKALGSDRLTSVVLKTSPDILGDT